MWQGEGSTAVIYIYRCASHTIVTCVCVNEEGGEEEEEEEVEREEEDYFHTVLFRGLVC